jgi:hypothetical protein
MHTHSERRAWPRISAGMAFAVTLGAVLLAWVAVNLDWIRQRHELLAEGEAVIAVIGRPNGAMADFLPPAGHIVSRFVLGLFGEPRVEFIVVYYLLGDEEGWNPAEESPKIKRARRLFPEAEIAAAWINQDEIDFAKESRGVDLRAMISE